MESILLYNIEKNLKRVVNCMIFLKILENYSKFTKEFFANKTSKIVKETSQYFTPSTTVDKMLKDLEIKEKPFIKILDPACGCGILLIKLLQKILKEHKPQVIEIDVFDIDKEALIITEELIKEIKIEGIKIKLKIFCEDFLQNSNLREGYDYIISNPPYKKTNIGLIPLELRKYSNGQPNLYHLFIARSLELLSEYGVFIVISPKNYLSGKYTENLRRFILNEFSITKIHTFNERNKIFGSEVLQEVCILHISKKKCRELVISYNGHEKFITSIDELLLDKEKNIIITPRDRKDVELLKKLKKLPENVIGKEIFMKVGKVVQFRVDDKENTLREERYEKVENGIPLIVYRHIHSKHFSYRCISEKNNNRAITVQDNGNHKSIFIKNWNYILLKKSTDKKTKKLIFAVPYLEELNSDKIALDNGLAYFTNKDDSLTKEDVLGIYCILNSKQFDDYYRIINSSHTLNVYELNSMHFPSIEVIKEIGKKCSGRELSIDFCTDIMEKILND